MINLNIWTLDKYFSDAAKIPLLKCTLLYLSVLLYTGTENIDSLILSLYNYIWNVNMNINSLNASYIEVLKMILLL